MAEENKIDIIEPIVIHQKRRCFLTKVFDDTCTKIVYLIVLLSILIPVNIKLVHDADICKYNLRDEEVLATIVSNSEGVICYNYSGNHCCLHNRGVDDTIGKKYFIYVSNSARCSLSPDKDDCSHVVMFNAIFFLFGAPLSWIVAMCISLPISICYDKIYDKIYKKSTVTAN